MTPEIKIGPPGTGKTTRLLELVDATLAAGTDPRRVGFVTFTRRGAREAIERACRKFGKTESDFPYFKTLHSICFRALGLSNTDVLERVKLVEFGDWIGVRVTGMVSMDEGSTFGNEAGDRILFMENLSRIRRVSLRAQYEENSDGLDWREVQRVAAGLAEFKRARGLLDYTDMLAQFVAGDVAPSLDDLLVDEGQDLSPLQWDVVDRMARDVKRFYVAGDDDQGIYRWAGAAVDGFVSMPGRVEVLGQSWRVPILAQRVASEVIGRVRSRRPKKWAARPEQGTVTRASRLDDLDLSGEVLILARNNFVIKTRVEPLLRSDGAIYEYRGHASVRPAVLEGIVAWEALRRGERVTAAAAARAYEQMSSGKGVRRGFKTLGAFKPDEEVGMADLRERGGLLVDDIWHRVMDRLPSDEKNYMLRALRKGEKLRSRPRVRLSTIHGSKGGEADHVVVLTDMASRTFREALQNPDDERRVWYVAVTRTRDRLSIVAPSTGKHFDL